MKCRHCKRRKATRARGLCFACYFAPAIRVLYPPGSANPATAKYVPTYRGVRAGETMADLDRIEAEQRKRLPAWWPGAGARDTE